MAKQVVGLIREYRTVLTLEHLQTVSGMGLAKAAKILSTFELARRYLLHETVKIITATDGLPHARHHTQPPPNRQDNARLPIKSAVVGAASRSRSAGHRDGHARLLGELNYGFPRREFGVCSRYRSMAASISACSAALRNGTCGAVSRVITTPITSTAAIQFTYLNTLRKSDGFRLIMTSAPVNSKRSAGIASFWTM
jgi:hypothetical protein